MAEVAAEVLIIKIMVVQVEAVLGFKEVAVAVQQELMEHLQLEVGVGVLEEAQEEHQPLVLVAEMAATMEVEAAVEVTSLRLMALVLLARCVLSGPVIFVHSLQLM